MTEGISVAGYAAANGLNKTESLILLGNKCRRGELVGFAVGGNQVDDADGIERLRYFPGGVGRTRAGILADNKPDDDLECETTFTEKGLPVTRLALKSIADAF